MMNITPLTSPLDSAIHQFVAQLLETLGVVEDCPREDPLLQLPIQSAVLIEADDVVVHYDRFMC